MLSTLLIMYHQYSPMSGNILQVLLSVMDWIFLLREIPNNSKLYTESISTLQIYIKSLLSLCAKAFHPIFNFIKEFSTSIKLLQTENGVKKFLDNLKKSLEHHLHTKKLTYGMRLMIFNRMLRLVKIEQNSSGTDEDIWNSNLPISYQGDNVSEPSDTLEGNYDISSAKIFFTKYGNLKELSFLEK